MAVKKVQKKVETYGTRKDYGARFKVVTFIVGLIVFVGLLSIGASFINDSEGVVTGNAGNVEVSPPGDKGSTTITTGNGKVVVSQGGASVEFEQLNFDFSLLETDPIIQELPAKSVIALKVGSQDYTITKSSVVKVKAIEPDLTISIPGSYLSSLNGGLCETVKKANDAGDLIITSDLSKASLTWKYKSMMKYKDCFGL